jgi:hypothetical protein
MNYSPEDLYVYEEGGETIIELPDPDEYRNARPAPRRRTRERRRRRERRRTRPGQESRRVVIRRPDADEMRAQPYPADEAMAPVVVQQPVIEQPPEYGVSIGGVQLSFGTVAGTLLTLGGIGVQLASHFVSVPEPPTGDQDDVVEDLVQFNQDKKAADRKLRLLGSIGRTLSDVGQLAAFRK